MDDDLPPAAKRALAEAEARRKAAEGKGTLPKELGGRDGPDPVLKRLFDMAVPIGPFAPARNAGLLTPAGSG